jgi:hypothetical protein
MGVLTPEAAIINKLLSKSSVTAIVGPRIYMVAAPAKYTSSSPADHIVVESIDAEDFQHMTASSQLLKQEVRISLFTSKYTTLMTLLYACRDALHTFRGAVTVGSDSVTIQNLTLNSYRDRYLTPKSAQDKGIYVKMIDADVWVNTTTPSG